MDEKKFWISLECRVCREFKGLQDRHQQFLSCDGFLPDDYDLDSTPPQITGRCWICNGMRQDEWKFALFLPRTYSSRDEIDWESIFPAENTTRWMALDERHRYIEIEPAVAVPDLS